MKFADEKSANRALNDAQHDHKFLLGEADTLFQTAAQLKELADSLAANDSPRALEIKMRYAQTQRDYSRLKKNFCQIFKKRKNYIRVLHWCCILVSNGMERPVCMSYWICPESLSDSNRMSMTIPCILCMYAACRIHRCFRRI